MNSMTSPLHKVIMVAILATALAGSSLSAQAGSSLSAQAGGPEAFGDPIGSGPRSGSHPAGDPAASSLKGSASNAEVKYVNNMAGDFVFNVVYDNATGSRFSLRVLDTDGYQLFQCFYSDKKFDKKFKITDAEGKFTFIIKNYQDNSTQRFEVNSNTRLVEDVEVKEVR
jgi:hypothetical protein